MKTRFIAIALLSPIIAWAQIPKDEYETITPDDPLASSYGKYFPGYYITKDGTQTDCLVLFETGDRVNDESVNLSTAMAYDGDVKMVDKRNLKAFFVNDRLYGPMKIGGVVKWGYFASQGAIHLVRLATYHEASIEKGIGAYYDEEKQTNIAYTDTIKLFLPFWGEVEYTQKLGNEPEVYPMINRKNMVKLVSDNAELATKIDNKERGYKSSLVVVPGQEPWANRMYAIYNKWYDEQNPGAITYFPTKATYRAPAPAATPQATASTAASQAYQETIEEIDNAYYAPRIDPFVGRPTVADASIASAKPEVAVKKESFKERLNRINADGNKVGVLVTSKNTVINPDSFSEGITPAIVKGVYGPVGSLDVLAGTTADELNKGFGVNVFEAVDYTKIPYKEGKYGKLDDWWSTKYKMIVLYELEPFYNAFYKTNTSSGEREYNAYLRVKGEMIVMAAEEAKPDKLKYVTNSPRLWCSYKSAVFIGPAETDFNTIQQLKEAVNPPTDNEIIKLLIEDQKPEVAKFIKKRSK